ncbi:hypothetical protein [Fructobacillus fructosus]|uniref:hypothetical protein n=1 Tax=Fructobacillus fructosus TaxID=1631 RepID=UPI00200A4C1C|nr:hypothetical protein [Fructobacillus fructosus]MCK8639063.1 hypothetical protein [Fructobacillus fructosus]
MKVQLLTSLLKNDRKKFNLILSDGTIKIVDLYQIVMRALSGLSNSDKITVDQIEHYIYNMKIEYGNQDKGKIRKSDIIRILNILSSIAADMNKADPIIEYKDPEKTVYMYDSFFSFNLKFHYRNE